MEKLVKVSKDESRGNAIIILLLYTGIRVGELCNLRSEDIDLQECLIRIRSGKGDKDRIVLIPEECSKILSSFYQDKIKSNKYNEFFFGSKRGKIHPTTVERIVRKVALKSGIERKVTPHTLRHTFATTVLKNGGDIRFIQQILGHASIAT
ncbi:tyrosine recombinase XerC, partial [mine drainage metagenome]